MAIVLTVGDRVSLRAWCVDGEQASVNTFYLRVFNIINTPLVQLVADYFATQFGLVYPAIINNNAFFQGCQARIENQLPLGVSADSSITPIAGTAGANALPRQSCGLTTWRTLVAGPRGRGRTYWPFPSASDNDPDSTPSAAYVNNVALVTAKLSGASGFVTMTDGTNTAVVQHYFWSRKYALFTGFSGGSTSDKWATLRKRGSYGRANTSPI